MGRFCWLVAGFLSFASAVSAQGRPYHTHWYYVEWPQAAHIPGHHGGWHHHKMPRPEFHKKLPVPAVHADAEAVDLLRRLLERLEQGQRPEFSALERARAEVHAAERHLAAARANLANLEGPQAGLPRMIVRPQLPQPIPAPTDVEQRLDRLQREFEELRRDLGRRKREE